MLKIQIMRKNKFIYGLLGCCLLWTTACDDPYEKEKFMAYNQQPIGIYLEIRPEYKEWVKLLRKADMYNSLNISVDYTCFVVSNQAVNAYFAKHGAANGWKTIDDMTEMEAKNLVNYHIIAGSSYDYVALNGKIPTQTVSGDFLTVKLGENSEKTIDDVKIMELKKGEDEEGPLNGTVMELTDVLNPKLFTVWDLLIQDPAYSLFTEGLKEAGLDSYLARRDIEINEKKIRDYKTVLAITNDVFEEAGISDLASLKTKFKGEPTDPTSDFYRFMAYHILSKEYDYGDLTSFKGSGSADGVKGQNVSTLASKGFITVADINNKIFLNPTDSIRILTYNIPASNGYIHVISKIMEIITPVPFGFEWEPTEWDEFRTIPFYREARTKNVGSENFFYFDKATDHVRWKSVPTGGVKVGYMSSDIDYDRFAYDDCLYADFTVNVGYIEFETPPLMAGKYNIKVVKWSWTNSGAAFQMYVDGDKFGAPIPMWGGSGGTEDVGFITFTESVPHVFRFRVSSISNNRAQFYLDRFIFTPVK